MVACHNKSSSEVEMICFEVRVNGEKICVAGVGDSGVLAAHVTWSQGRQSQRRQPQKPHLHVGGLVNNEHVRWTENEHVLEVGDEVTFKVVEAGTADEPIHKYPQER
jgi:hypothetical protein